MNSNLPGFGFHEFILNHFKICPKSNLRLCNISPEIFPQEIIVLSSSKLHISDFETMKMFMKMLKRKGPRIYPCGIPQITYHQLLKLEPIFVICLRLLR